MFFIIFILISFIQLPGKMDIFVNFVKLYDVIFSLILIFLDYYRRSTLPFFLVEDKLNAYAQ